MLYYVQQARGHGWIDVASYEDINVARLTAAKTPGLRAVSGEERVAGMMAEVLQKIIDATSSRDKDVFRAQIDIAKLCLSSASYVPVHFGAEGLTHDQYACLVDIVGRHNVFITGPAGTGKSFLLRFLKTKFGRVLRVVATTGVAAINVGGATLHSWAGIGLGDGSAEKLAEAIMDNPKAFARIVNTRMLAVDEVSMLDADLFERLDLAFKIVRKNTNPFGGIQMVFFGDFLQLPPVAQRDKDALFAFQSPAWKLASIVVHHLTTVVRQKDAVFVEALSRIRHGVVDPFVRQVLLSRIGVEDTAPQIDPIVLECRNIDVDAFNRRKLAALAGDEVKLLSSDRGDERFVAMLDKSCLAPADLRLKIGAQVMLLKNLDVEGGLVNGTIGLVEAVEEDSVRVNFGDSGTCDLERGRWTIFDNDGNEMAHRDQIPLRLAYAITIHKSQGCSLSKAKVNLRSTFACGQAYVALSRVRELSGLYIEDIRWESIMASPEAIAFYQSGA